MLPLFLVSFRSVNLADLDCLYFLTYWDKLASEGRNFNVLKLLAKTPLLSLWKVIHLMVIW